MDYLNVFESFTNSLINSASPSQTGGPVVKTGPTAGQNRSRNKDGRWRNGIVNIRTVPKLTNL